MHDSRLCLRQCGVKSAKPLDLDQLFKEYVPTAESLKLEIILGKSEIFIKNPFK